MTSKACTKKARRFAVLVSAITSLLANINRTYPYTVQPSFYVVYSCEGRTLQDLAYQTLFIDILLSFFGYIGEFFYVVVNQNVGIFAVNH